MQAATAGEPRRFDHLREHSIGLPQVLFESIAHMAQETGEPEDEAVVAPAASEPA